MWDRCFGGSTIILHIDGTTAPKTLLTPDRLKCHVHLPPHFVNEHPQSHLAIAHIVQTFIEHVGIPTVARWKRAAHTRGWSLSQSGHATAAHPPAAQLIPVPSSGTTHYIFWGRPWHNLPALTPSPSPASPATLDPSTSTDLLTVELTAAKALADERLGVIVEYEDREDRFLEREQEYLEQQAQLQEEIKYLTERIKGVLQYFYSI